MSQPNFRTPNLHKAVAWNVADVTVRLGGQFIFAVLLARLIAPSEFGLVALLSIFSAVASVLIDSGFGAALVQDQATSHRDESTVFWFNLTIGAVIAVGLGLAGGSIARFYNAPQLEALCWAMALNIWINAWNAVPNALLTKRLAYKLQVTASITAVVTSGVAAVVLGALRMGAWALIAQYLIASLATTIVIWTSFRWRPSAIFEWSAIRRLGRFGSYMLVSSVLESIVSRLYTVLIGRYYTPTQLGFYTRAAQTCEFPQTAMNFVVLRIAFPVFSSSHGRGEPVRRQFERALVMAHAVSAPIMMGLAATAPDTVPVVFGARWLPSVIILQVLSVVGMIYPFHVLNLNVLMATGHSRLYLRAELVKKFLLVIAVLIAYRFSVPAIAFAVAVISLAGIFINGWYAQRLIGCGFQVQLRRIAPYVLAAITMGLFITLIRHLFSFLSPAPRLALELVGGAGAYSLLTYAFSLEGALFWFRSIHKTFIRILNKSPDGH